MGFKFRFLCELLQDLESNKVNRVIPISRRQNPDRKLIKEWFDRHNAQIPRTGDGAIAFLSCLFPQKRVDRVYAIQELRLSLVLGRCLGLGTTRLSQLNQWKERGGVDLASCVENVMRDAENPAVAATQEVTLEEIDNSLERIASRCKFSSAEVRRKHRDTMDVHEILPILLRKLRSWEAKWLVRLVLKNFTPLDLPETYTLLQFHFLLPNILQVQNSFASAVSRLEETARLGIRYRCPREDIQGYMKKACAQLAPKTGVFIQRPAYSKARSIKHCCHLAALRRISLERKYDGEYCQIQINTANCSRAFKIFSKSGKDSTDDRSGIHNALKRSLLLGEPDCMVKSRCILEGELLVWNDEEGVIQPFHKIRRYVSRSGRFLGRDQDSIPKASEHLMIMFYDLLLLDDDISLHTPHNIRRARLNDLVIRLPGLTDIGTREVIDFRSRNAAERLRFAFARSITDRWEGFVLKGYDDPYFPISCLPERSPASCIKLKKDYFAGMGDKADFAVIGGRYDARDAHFLKGVGNDKVRWTSFHIACLENMDAVTILREKPRFRVMDVLNHRNITSEDILELNRLGQFEELKFPSEEASDLFEIVRGPINSPAIAQMFRKPFVIELTGGGFDRPPNANFRTLRFPRSSKLHLDRTFESTTSFDELQAMAKAADSPPDRESQEDMEWVERLQKAGRTKCFTTDTSQSLSPGSSATLETVQSRCDTTNFSAFVRMDSSEIRSNEYRSPDGHVKTTADFRSETLISTSKKRKAVPRDSPFEGIHPTKKIRASPPMVQRRQRRTLSLPANHNDALIHRPASALKEIRNISPNQSRRLPPEPVRRSEKRIQKTVVRDEASLSDLASASQSVKRTTKRISQKRDGQASGPIVADATLLTPPTSSSEEGNVGAWYENCLDGTKEMKSRLLLQRAESNVSFDAETSFSAHNFESSIVIVHVAKSLSKVSRRHGFYQLVNNANVALTYSRRYFLRRLALVAPLASESKRIVGVVLVRAAEADKTAEEIADFEQAVEDIEQLRDTKESVTVLFMDWRYLALLQGESNARKNLSEKEQKRLEECFAGALEWKTRDASDACNDLSDKDTDYVRTGSGSSHSCTEHTKIEAHFERERFWEELSALDGFMSPA